MLSQQVFQGFLRSLFLFPRKLGNVLFDRGLEREAHHVVVHQVAVRRSHGASRVKVEGPQGFDGLCRQLPQALRHVLGSGSPIARSAVGFAMSARG